MSHFKVVRCLGDGAIQKALDQHHEKGYSLHTAIFSGMAEVTQESSLITGRPQATVVPAFTLIFERFELMVDGGKLD